jgi:hypothetical protein
MHHDNAVAAIADAYHATRSDQRGSKRYVEMCALIIERRNRGEVFEKKRRQARLALSGM